MGNFELKKCKDFDHCELLRALRYFDLSTRLGKSPLDVIQNNQKITIFKNTIAGQIVFALFGTKVLYCGSIY